MAADETLRNASTSLAEAVGMFKSEATGSFSTLNQRFEEVIAEEGEQAQVQQEIIGQLRDVVSEAQNARTQDLTARMILESGVVEGVEAPTGDVEQIQAFSTQLASYVENVQEINEQYVEGTLSQVEAHRQLEQILERETRLLENQTGILDEGAGQVGALKDAFGSITEAIQADMEEGGSLGGLADPAVFEAASEAYEQYSNRVMKSLQNVRVGAGAVETSLTAALSNPWLLGGAVLAAGIASLVDRFVELDAAAQDFMDETGFGLERSRQVRQNVADLSPQLRAAGLEASDLVGATTTLADRFGSFDNAAQQLDSTFDGIQDPASALRNEITAVAGRLRLSGQEAAELISDFETVATATGVSRQNLQTSAMAAAQTADVAPKQVMQDIAENSEQLAKFSGMSGERLASAAAQANNLGTNIGQVAELNEQILTDIPGFVQGLEKARTLAPQIGIDPQQLTRAAAQGPDALTAELEEQFQGVDMGNLDFFTKQRLSDAFGMSTAQLTKIAERANEADQSMGDLTKKVQQGDASMAQMFERTGAQTQLTRLQNQFSALAGVMSKLLVPVFGEMADVLAFSVPKIRSFVQWSVEAATATREWFKSLGPVGETVTDVTGALAGIGGIVASWSAFSATVSAMVPFIGTLSGGIGSLLGVMGSLSGVTKLMAFGRLVSMQGALTTLASTIWSSIIPAFSAIAGFISSTVIPAVTSAAISIGTTLSGALGTATTAMYTFAAGLSATGIGAIVVGIGAAIGGLVYAIRNWDQTTRVLMSTWQTLKSFFTGGAAFQQLNTAIKEYAISGFETLVGWVERIPSLLMDAVQAYIDIYSTIGSFALDALSEAGSMAASAFADAFEALPGMIMSALSGIGSAIMDAITPNTQVLSQTMSSVTGTISSYLPSSPAETGPLSDLDKVDITGEISKSIQPEPVKQQMETTMGEATQAATDNVQPQQIEQANQVQVDGGGSAAQPDQSQQIPDGIIPLLRKIANNEQQILNAIQNQELDAYMDSKKVTDNLRKNNNKNLMRM